MIILLFQAFLDTFKRMREILKFYGLEKIAPLVTSQQAIKYNNSHKWLNWVTKTKIQILSYTLTLSIMLVEY